MKQGKPIRVMLVDDHLVVRSGLGAVLMSEEDLSLVGEAGNGEEAIRMCERLQPDVVLMDVKMPGIDGDESLKLLKSMQPVPKVIFITAYDDGGKTKARLLNMGAFACLDKPISSLKDLENTINKAVEK